MDGRDGLSATAYPSGIAGVPVEVMENIAPLVIHRRSLRPDSGGPAPSVVASAKYMDIDVLTDEPIFWALRAARAMQLQLLRVVMPVRPANSLANQKRI